MLENLSANLKKGFERITNAIFLDKKIIESSVKDLQRALIQADVNVQLVKELGDKIKKEAENEKIKGIEKKEHIIKILHDEILNLIGKEKHELELEKGKNKKVILVGLYGCGKTTTAIKLANYYLKRGFKTAVLGLDVHRPAATEQLEQLGKQAKIQVFIEKNEKDPIKIYKKYKDEIKKYDLVIIDTAGRHDLDKELIKEIISLEKEIKPHYTLLTIQADIGQAAKKQASEFQKACNINGVIITRMDSSAKAGGALTACNETKAPIFFIGTGEKINEIESFNPKSFISRILGLGDLESLIEKVQSAIDEKTQTKAKQKLKEGIFDLRDFQQQLKQIGNVGSFSKIIELIPGFKKEKVSEKIFDNQEEKIKRWQYAIDSMTKEEIENPEIIEKQTTRLGRIAKGSGITTSDIRQLIKQYKLLKEILQGSKDLSNFDSSQGLSQKQIQKLAKKFGRKLF